ncbi:MAG: TonB-dependent receptor [Pseudomonas sp.]|nr:TonB-dependent receptor [Pseudomonas sp.]
MDFFKSASIVPALALLLTTSLSAEEIVLDEMIISGKKSTENGYLNQFEKQTSTASRMGITIKETPASVEILDSETMEKRGDTTVAKAVEKAVGMTSGASGHGPGGYFTVRGFGGFPGVDFLTDGIKLGGNAFSKRATEVANLERIEVIRGAASVLHGEGSVGATINLITKKPSFEKQDTQIGLNFGSFDSYRLSFGTGGVAVDDILAYRFDVSSREIGSNIDGQKKEIDSLNLGFLYKINDKLFATLSAEKTKDNIDSDYQGTPLINKKLDKSVRNKNYNNLKDGLDNANSLWIKQGIEWYPTSNIEVKNQLYYQKADAEVRRLYRAVQDTVDPSMVNRAGYDTDQTQDLIGNRLDLIYKDNIFGLGNRFLVGTDVNKMSFSKNGAIIGSNDGDKVSMYNPAKGYYKELGNNYKVKDMDADVESISIYMEDILSLTSDLKLVLGLRHDTLDVKWDYYHANDKKSRKYNNLSYRAGMVYDLTDTTTLYVAYSTSIAPGGGAVLTALSPAQTKLDLTEAVQYEIGLRQSFLNDKAEFTASAYKIDKNNLFVTDPNNINKLLNAGKQSSKGLEFSLGIKPIEKLQIDANLSITDAKYDSFVSGATDYSGNTPHSIPKYIANLGFRYMPISNVGIGTWIRYVDSIYTGDSNRIELPSYTTADLTMDYALDKKTTFSFAVKNVTDKFYATSARNDNQVFLGDPRNFEVGVNYKF